MQLTRRTLACAGASMAGLALAGASGQALAQSAPRALVINISLEPDGLDPTSAAAASIGEVVHYNVLEGLTRIEESGATSPLLAQAWEMSADGKTYTFHLQPGVRFHDGAAFDAAAVLFTFERAKAPDSRNKARKALFDNMASVTAPDPLTVVLQLHRADGNTLFRLGESTAVILHPASAAQAARHPVGTGPYRLEHWDKGSSITLTKHEAYRRAAQVRVEKAVFRFVNGPDDQVGMVQSGEVDVLFNFATQNVGRLEVYKHYQVLIGASSGKGMLALNHRRKPLGDVRMRRAISHAIDRESFIRAVLDGRGKAIGSHFSPTDAGYVHLAGMYPYDPSRSRALMKEAGVQTPLKMTLTLPPTPYARAGGPVLAASLAKVGIVLKLEQVEWPQWLAGAFKGQFDMTLINHVEPLDYQIYTDPAYYFGYDSQPFRDLVERHAASVNARERQILFVEIQRYLAMDAVNAWIFAPQVSTVVRKGIKGVWMNYPIFAHDIAAMRWE
ncbi:ABC transporter substrate-binding protein [Simplicispira piscis]